MVDTEEADANIDGNAILISKKVPKPTEVLLKITVEPIFFAGMVTIIMYSIISNQYIYYRISKDYGIENATQQNSSTCNENNETGPTEEILTKISSETSNWILYLNIAGFIPSFFCTVLMGAWGDVVGRRIPLLCSLTGLTLMIVVYIITIHFELSVSYLLIARVVGGLGGDFTAILCSCYAYLADISTQKERTVRVAIGEASTGIGGILASLVSGVWIDAQGFETPLWILCAILIALLLYVLFVLNESLHTPLSVTSTSHAKLRSFFSCHHFMELWRFLSEDLDKTRKLLGIMLCFFIQLVVFDGVGDTIIVYELSRPLCWPPTLIGYGSALQDFSFLFGMIVLKLFHRRLSDIWWVFFAVLSTSAGLVSYAFAYTTWIMFLGFTLSLLTTIGGTILRSMMSRLVGPREQGSGFALIACSESIASLVGSFIFNSVYSATVTQFRGAVFLVGVGIEATLFLVFSFVYKKTKSDLATVEAEEYHNFDIAS